MSEPWSWQQAYGQYSELEQGDQQPPDTPPPPDAAANPGAPPWAQSPYGPQGYGPQGYGPQASGGYPRFLGYPPPPAVARSGLGFLVAAFICGGLALLFLPIILGPLGIIFGFVAYSKGNKVGLWAGVGSILTTVLGLMLSFWAFSTMRLGR